MRRQLMVAAVATTLLAAGCSGDTPAPESTAKPETASETTPETTPTTQSATAAPAQTTPAEAPVPADQTLDGSACVDITGANLDLAVATNTDDARAAADTFEKYNPPADVRDAIEHFVNTGGAQYDDPEYDRYNSLIDNWVKQVCPL